MASEILDELVQLIGHHHSIELLRAWGGRRIKLPETVDQDHPLAFVVGLEAAQKIVHHYGHINLDLPAERNFLIDLRNAAILSDFQGGSSITALACIYGVSRRQVNSILDAMGHRALRLERAGSRT